MTRGLLSLQSHLQGGGKQDAQAATLWRKTYVSKSNVSNGDRPPIMTDMKSTLPKRALNGMKLSTGALAVLPDPPKWNQMKCRLVNAAFLTGKQD